jgi:putative endonuclease
MRHYFVYILASKRNGTLYTGVTGALNQRVWEHREEIFEGFTKRYGVKLLVYYEVHEDPSEAIKREKQIKRWRRAWKLRLIEKDNPQWADLYDNLLNELPIA